MGYDTDSLAVTAARDNGDRNGLADRLEIRHGSLPAVADERFSLVVANLVAAVLVDLAQRLADHVEPGGVLLAGGIIAPRADEVVGALGAVGLTVTDRRDDGEWVALRLEARR